MIINSLLEFVGKGDNMDQRIIKTKQKIVQTFIELLEEKTFDQITVLKICQKAKINRTTFYTHYHDKYSLLEGLEQESLKVVGEFVSRIEFHLKRGELPFFDEDILRETLTNLYKQIAQNASFIRTILSVKGDFNFQYQLNKHLVEAIKENITSISDKVELQLPFNYFCMLITQIQLGFIKEWLNSDTHESPEELAQIVSRTILGLSKTIISVK